MERFVKRCAKHGELAAKDCYGPFLRNKGNCEIYGYNCKKCAIEFARNRVAKNPQAKEAHRESMKRYYNKNRKLKIMQQEQWNLKNRDRTIEYGKAHYQLQKGNAILMEQYKRKYSKENICASK